MSVRAVLLVALTLSVLSCSAPRSKEVFVKGDGGPFSFEVDMTGEDCRYDISFYTRLDSKDKVQGFPIKVKWIDPDGLVYYEEVYFDCSKHLKNQYRTGLVPVKYGVWTVEASASAPGMQGLGLICEKVY